ncbi:MAG TPA: FtsX-like permease family protein [Steroidobacteraceae bacterium]
MLLNYLAVAVRNLAQNRLYSTISIVGLAVGLCAATLAGVVLRSELTYEHFIAGYENLYFVATVGSPSGRAPFYSPGTPSFVAGILKLNLPQAGAVTRIVAADVRLRHGQVEAREKLYWADPNAFDLLRLPVIAGDLSRALRSPGNIVLTRSIAEKYFGRVDAVGRTVRPDEAHDMAVAAVIQDLPAQGTTLETGIFASAITSYSALGQCDRDAPGNASRGAVMLCGRTYVQVASQTPLGALQAAVDHLLASAFPKFPGMSMSVRLIPIDRVHLFEGLNPGIQARLAIIGAVAVLILFASCVVFVNLATARSIRRALEVGVRKACGASRTELILQFLGESVMQVAVAACLGLGLAGLVLPAVNVVLDSGGQLSPAQDPQLAMAVVAGVLLVGVLAGAYPAFVLSAFRPSMVLKGSVSQSVGSATARQSLVVVQFAILIGLILAASVIYRQCIYATREALRVNTDEILLIRGACRQALLNEVRALPGVRGAYCSSQALLDRAMFLNARLRDGSPVAIDVAPTDFGAFSLYGIVPLAGTLPPEGSAQSPRHVVINETAARRFGFRSPGAAVGQPLPLTEGLKQLADTVQASSAEADHRRAAEAGPRSLSGTTLDDRIVAVVPDFSFDVAARKIRPAVFLSGLPQNYGLINVRLTGREIPATLIAIDRIGAATGADEPLDRFFLNEYIKGLYLTVLREAQAFGGFAAVALVLACLGLLGLSAATAGSRTREIGIRKAMGAGTADILRMLLWQFSTPILWASLLAWPLTGFLLLHWLDDFADHVELGPWPFLVSSAAAMVIALLTVGAHATRIARAKPVAALRYE